MRKKFPTPAPGPEQGQRRQGERDPRRGDVDQGKMSIIGGAIIAAAPAVIFAFYKIFGIDGNSSVGVGNF